MVYRISTSQECPTLCVHPILPALKCRQSADSVLQGHAHVSDIDSETADLMRKRARDLEGHYRQTDDISKPVGWDERIMSGIPDWWRSDRPSGNSMRRSLLDDMADTREGLYRVVEFHDRRAINRVTLYDTMTRQTNEIPADKASQVSEDGTIHVDEEYVRAEMAKMNQPMRMNSVSDQLWITAICPALLSEKCTLEQPYIVQGKGFQHKPIFCFDYHPDITETQALIDNLISAQDSHNQRRMTQLELFMNGVNASYVANKDAIAPEDMDAWLKNERGKIKLFQGTEAPQREFPAPFIIQGIGEFASEDQQMIPILSGIPPNAMGFQQSNREGAALYNQRVTAGLIMLQYFFSHFNRGLEHVFSYVDGLIQHFMTTEREVRLLSEPPEGADAQQMNKDQVMAWWVKVNEQTLQGLKNDISQGEYDFKPDPTKLGETARRQTWYELVELWKLIPPLFQDWPTFFEAWDNPIGQKLAANARQKMQQMAPQQEKTTALQQGDIQAQIMERGANAQKKLADAEAKKVQSKVKAVNDSIDAAQKLFPINSGVQQ